VTPEDDPRFTAAVALLGRTGADTFQIRYCEEEDPTVWMAIAHWPAGETRDQRPAHYEAAGGMTPWRALFRLCEATMDGGTCRHCHRPTVVDDGPAIGALVALEEAFCAYRYDPELATFRRSCEGVRP
jgi:hypothetical protein